jgi:hydrogenase nickel incorporation protein HypA/HybF
MHELSLVMEVYRGCREAMAAHGGGRLEWVRLAVGELAAVEPELLRFAWESALADGPDEGAELQVEWRPVTQTCDSCGPLAERLPGAWLRVCPRCGGSLHLEGGDELIILQLSFQPPGEEEEDTDA